MDPARGEALTAKRSVPAKRAASTKRALTTKRGVSAKGRTARGVEVSPHLIERLVKEARAVRERAHAPYSRYFVGAAIATRSGAIFKGCNVENASYGGCICAERGAIMQMVAAGERHPIACVVVTAGERAGSPCGICRQVLAEFAKDMTIVMVGITPRGETRRATTLHRLLPDAFTPESLLG
jgi:cytidine deaminase